MTTARQGCRVCPGSLVTVLDLGNICLNAFPKPDEPDTEKCPVELTICDKCSLVQLRHMVDQDKHFRDYYYKSSVTETMKAALADVVKSAKRECSVRDGDVVCDIGANDGSLLRNWPLGVNRIGFEPALNLAAEARKGGNSIITQYFSAAAYKPLAKAQVVTAIAMFYSVPDPGAFLDDVRSILAPNGIFVVQVNYIEKMLATNDFPAATHEHQAYWSLTRLVQIHQEHGLYPFQVEFNNVNGGSVRLFSSRIPGRKPAAELDIQAITNAEREVNEDVTKIETYKAFGERVVQMRQQVREILETEKKRGPIGVIGASTKGNLMLQYFGLGCDTIDFASDRDPRKHGLQTVGTRIPIVSEEEARAKAKTMLVSIWPFRDEIVQREREWLNAGGKLLFPMPRVELMGANEWTMRKAD